MHVQNSCGELVREWSSSVVGAQCVCMLLQSSLPSACLPVPSCMRTPGTATSRFAPTVPRPARDRSNEGFEGRFAGTRANCSRGIPYCDAAPGQADAGLSCGVRCGRGSPSGLVPTDPQSCAHSFSLWVSGFLRRCGESFSKLKVRTCPICRRGFSALQRIYQ